MEYLTFSWWDYSLFSIMLGLSGLIGIYYGCFGSKQSTTADYFYGGNKMKVFPVSMSLVASAFSGVVLMGFPADVYIYGTQSSIIVLSVVPAGLITGFVYLPVFYKLKQYAAFQYLEIRFDRNVRKMVSFVYVLFTILETPLLVYSSSLAFNQVTSFSSHTVASFMSVLCIIYTAIGGFKTVIWTDALQITVTLCTLVFILVMGLNSVGGFEQVWKTAERGNRIEFFNTDPDPTLRATFWSVFIGHIFPLLNIFGTNPAAVQRYKSVPTLNDSKRSERLLVISVVITIITRSISFFMGLIMYAKYYDCDPLSIEQIKKPDQIVPYYILDVANQIPGLSGLFIASLFSVSLSTLSTRLNVLSGTIFADFVAPFVTVDTAGKSGSAIMKIITVIIGLTTILLIFLMERLGTLFEVLLTINGVVSGVLVGVFTAGMLFPMVNAKGALYGVTGSFVLMFWIGFKKQMCIWDGTIKYQPKPLYTYGCNLTSISASSFNKNVTSISNSLDTEEPFWLFRITFLYYGFIGTLITLTSGLLISWATKNNNEPVNAELFSPFVRRCRERSARRAQYNSVETSLCVFNTNNNDEEN